MYGWLPYFCWQIYYNRPEEVKNCERHLFSLNNKGKYKNPPPANAGGEPLNKSYSIAIELPEASFLGSSFGTMIVRTPYSYLALMSSGLISPTKKLRWQTPA